MNYKKIIVLVLSIVIVAMAAGCIDSRETDKGKIVTTDKPQSPQSQGEILKGEIKLDGSTTVYPVAVHAANDFMQAHPEVKIIINQSSTGEGLVKFLAGETTISDATRPPKEAEYQKAKNNGMTLHMTNIAFDGVVVIVHPFNPLTGITYDQLKEIYYSGKITDWKDLTNGTKTGKINVYHTDPKISGTAQLFNNKITGNDETPYVSRSITIHPTPLMIPTIMNDPNGIAFTPINWVNSSVKALQINGVTPSRETIKDTSYPLARDMLMITNGPPQGIAKEYINYILSRDGQKIVEEEGFIPIT